MTVRTMDERSRASYLRRVRFVRPSRVAMIATVAASTVLAAAGFFAGRASDDVAGPASVPVKPAERAVGPQILIPDPLELPER